MNKDFDKNVNLGDQICATLECNGHRLASINGMGFSSLEAVKHALLDLAGRYAGMAVVTVRNCTQGWRDVTALATMRRPVLMSQVATIAGNGQYMIPWAS
ncbi:MAG: hypothetical protein IKX18_00555 [Muribaculaceae bacterium]|nr:hypothetical protein [Muribaculaceae bacterium]